MIDSPSRKLVSLDDSLFLLVCPQICRLLPQFRPRTHSPTWLSRNNQQDATL